MSSSRSARDEPRARSAPRRRPRKTRDAAPRAGRASLEERPRVEIDEPADLRRWLEQNHATSAGAWIVTRKKAAGGTVRWTDIVEEVLCFGWVDSLPRALDAGRTMLLVTPRKPTSKWSAKNKKHIEALVEAKRLHPAGLAAVARAKQNGTWSALDEVSALVVPRDLLVALDAHPRARENWDSFPPSTRRGILEWIAAAKRAPTRASRIAETAQLASKNVRANQWPR